MADNSSIWFNGGFVRNVNPGNTQRFALGTASQHTFVGLLVEPFVVTKIYQAATISHLAMHLITNPNTIFGGATVTVTLMVNNNPTSLVISWAPGVIGYKVNTTNTVSVVPGDEVWVRTQHSNVFEFTATQNNISVIYTPDDTGITVVKTMADQYSAFVPLLPGTTHYIALHGLHDNGSTNQQERQDCIPIASTGKNLRVGALFNSFNGPTIFTLQKNGIDTTVTATVSAGSTAFVEDIVHSVAFAAHDRAGWKVDTTASSSGAMNIASISGEFHNTSNEWFLGAGQIIRTPPGASAAIAIAGENYFLDPEASDQWSATLRGRTIGLCVNIRANSATGDSYFRWRNGAINGATEVVIPSMQTGFFDGAGPDVWEVGNLLSIAEFTTGGGQLSFSTVDWAGSFFFPPPPPECPGDTGDPRIDGLPYVPPPAAACPGAGATGGSRTGL